MEPSRTLRVLVGAVGADPLSPLEIVVPEGKYRTLETFVELASELESTQFVREGMKVSLRMSFHASVEDSDPNQVSAFVRIGDHEINLGKGSAAAEPRLPPADQIRAFLLMLRFFVLEKEGTFFMKVRSILARRIDLPEVRSYLKDLQNQFEGKHIRDLFEFGAGVAGGPEVVLSSERELQQWLNGFFYHADAEKRERLKALHQVFPLEVSQVFFVAFMAEKARAVFKLRDLIEVMMGTRDRSLFQVTDKAQQ